MTMSLTINPITNPHTNGRGQAVELHPEATPDISVRYDEYDCCPAFFATLRHPNTTLANFDELDEGVALRFVSIDGEFTILLPMTAAKLINEFNAAVDEWAQS